MRRHCENVRNQIAHGPKQECQKWRGVAADDKVALRVCRSLEVMTVSKQSWIMLHRECARAALCQEETCNEETTRVLMFRSFDSSYENYHHNVDWKTDSSFLLKQITMCDYTSGVIVFHCCLFFYAYIWVLRSRDQWCFCEHKERNNSKITPICPNLCFYKRIAGCLYNGQYKRGKKKSSNHQEKGWRRKKDMKLQGRETEPCWCVWR